MKKLLLSLLITCTAITVQAQEMESATDAVKHMGIGWNLGNTLESTATDTLNFWTEWSHNNLKYETQWGQPKATRELIHMFKEAGFTTIRVPVTWFPHMGIKTSTVSNNGNYYKYWYMSKWKPTAVEADWMARVKEVVNYVIDEGMYCILNVHHDTGTGTAAWIKASMTSYNKYQTTYENLWTQIANEFKDYDEHLLFEGYNEMTDKYDSWCFATFGSSSKYNATDAADAYKAVNSYAQSFVNAVRATGGNNTTRNLIVNTYAGCSGEGTWNSHLVDPLNNLTIPTDPATSGHLCAEVHAYPSIKSGLSNAKSSVAKMMTQLKSKIVTAKKVPLIIGEWGTSNDIQSNTDDYNVSESVKADKIAFAKYFVQQATTNGFATIYWMGLSDKEDRTNLKWTQPEVKDAIVTGYYGEGGYVSGITPTLLTQPSTPSAAYTITGQRISNSYKGLVIRNGKKYVVK